MNVPAGGAATSFPFNGTRRDLRHQAGETEGVNVDVLVIAGGAGTVWDPFTHSGGGLTDALVFGQRAGQHAARSR